jgi:hypothetical protein
MLGARNREVIQIHWGGGTPTFLPPEDLTELMAAICRHFRVAPDCEIGIEVDPRECSEEHLDALAAAGVNRLSMGLQELDPKVQRAINRQQSAAQTWAVIDGARKRGHQTPEGFVATTVFLHPASVVLHPGSDLLSPAFDALHPAGPAPSTPGDLRPPPGHARASGAAQ